MSNIKKAGFSTRNEIKDANLLIAAGVYPGISSINKFGESPNITGGEEEEIWDGAAAYSWPATALMTSISQTADQAALRGATIRVEGLDANWDYVAQDAVLDATLTTNVVTLDTPLIRCFRMIVHANVVTASPVRVHNAGETQDYAIIQTGNNQTLMAIYAVPAGHTAYCTRYYASHHRATGQAPTGMHLTMWARDNANSYAAAVKHVYGLPLNGDFSVSFSPYYKFTEKTDIFLTGAPIGADANISAGFDLILIDNDILG